MTNPALPPDASRVLVLGGANMDIAATAPQAMAAGESMPGRVRSAPGGVARNVAENLARLGHAVRLICALGDDLFGLSLLQATRSAGVNVDGCLMLPGRASGAYVSLHGVDGEMALAVNDMDIMQALTPERLAVHAGPLRDACAIVLDCNLSPEALQWLFAQPRRGPVFADAVSSAKAARLRPWLAQVHTLKVNRAEAQALCGMPVQSLDQARVAAAWFVGQGVRLLALTLGAQGVCWFSANGASGQQAAPAVQVVNASGAGDALLAGLVHAHLAGNAPPQALPFAVACAAMTLQSESANHCEMSVAAVRAWMADRPSFFLAAKSAA